jgi:hypothetical protein
MKYVGTLTYLEASLKAKDILRMWFHVCSISLFTE